MKTSIDCSRYLSFFLSALLLTITSNAVAQPTTEQTVIPKFRAQTIDSKVIIGYGTAIGDVDGDGKPDILLADKKQFVWYQNPTWQRHVIAENLTDRDNVCIAARDIDGDGKVEIAVGGQWNPSDTVNSGSVHYLVAPPIRTQKWTPIKLQHEPVVHRMRWLKLAEKKFALIVAPLHGRGNKGGAGDGVKLLAYYKPLNPNKPWKTEILDDQYHVTHNFDVGNWNEQAKTESVFYLGKEGGKLIYNEDGTWNSLPFTNVNGGGEIRVGRFGRNPKKVANSEGNLANQPNFITTIEPFHGTELVVYTPSHPLTHSRLRFANRVVLDKNLNQGHAIAVADLLGSGSQQIVAGWRHPNDLGQFGIKLYYQSEPPKQPNPKAWSSQPWKSIFIDKNKMACEDLRIGDLNGDGRPDIVASGRSTHNLKIYWNEVPERDSAPN
ncbi:MAG: FG-GAP-like repeat-containing protein [Mariniblastus sp.]|nr:FG-GAP-like repeat-containing protein [Mariniblastus sp.]